MKVDSIFIRKGKLRAGWRILIFAPCLILTGILFFRLLPLLPIPSRYRFIASDILAFFLLLVISVLFARLIDKRPGKTIGFSFQPGFLKEYLLGVLISFIMVGLIFLIEWAAGFIKVSPSVITRELIFKAGFLSLVFFIFQSAGEELLFRGYIFQNLIEGTNNIIAIIILSILFGLAHIKNPNASFLSTVNTVLAGIWLSIAYLKTRSLWLASGLHFSWNYFMGTIFGLPVSGGIIKPTLLNTTSIRGETLSGGSYGPEGGIICTVILILTSWYILRSKRIAPAPEVARFWERYTGK
jgi:membrane protease YdiL (CAAX protease family)